MGAERCRLICGIAGFSLSSTDPSTNSRRMAGTMLMGIEHRGPDATGAAWYDPQGEICVQKFPVKASAFVRNLSMWRKSPMCILHTRNWTQGSPENPDNNHPISTGNIVGVHNGCIHNDHELFWDLYDAPRFGQVDSEAAFAAIAWGEKFSKNMTTVKDALEAIEGSAALAWLDHESEEPTLHLARVCSSPLIVKVNEHGSLFFASTHDTIDTVFRRMNYSTAFEWELEEGQYITVRDGVVDEARMFTPAGMTWRSYGSKSATAKAAGHTTTTSPTGKTTTTHLPGGSSIVTLRDAAGAFAGFGNAAGTSHKEYGRTGDFEEPAPTITSRAVKNEDADINSKYLDSDEPVEYPLGDFCFDYRVRLNLIDNYEAQHGTALTNAAGGNLRPGDWVRTVMLDDWYWGQILDIPDRFPGGHYLVRVITARAGYDVDVAIVRRNVDDLDWSDAIDQRTSPYAEDVSYEPDDDLGDRLGRVLAAVFPSTEENTPLELPAGSDDDTVAELYVSF